MSDKAKKGKVSDARIFYIGLIAAVAVVQIVLKVFTTLVPDAQSQVFSRITEGIMLIFAVMFALRTTFVQPWFGLKIEKSDYKRTALTCLLLAFALRASIATRSSKGVSLSLRTIAYPFFICKSSLSFFLTILYQKSRDFSNVRLSRRFKTCINEN